MAIISCPNCGKKISDKSERCIHCEFEIPKEKKTVTCVECGLELDDAAVICPKCGCPTKYNKESDMQQVQISGINVTIKDKKKFTRRLIVFAVVLVLILCGIQISKNNSSKEYKETLNQASIMIITCAATAEECGNLINNVWHNSIYEEADIETDRYTKPRGYFVEDFNDALSNLFYDESFEDDLNTIRCNQERINSIMKELKNPPAEYKEAYDLINELYDAYIKLSNLALNPTGNLSSYSQNFSKADAEVLECYNKVEVYVN